MSNRQNDNDRLHLQQFRTRDPNTKSVFLDSGRAEVMINMIVAPDFTDERLVELIGAAFGASNGNPDILRLAIEAFSGWYPPNSDVLAQISGSGGLLSSALRTSTASRHCDRSAMNNRLRSRPP